ncbi:DNA-3-methyladenine glycosylase family protein [Hymenobacter terrestris]|uniref:DNA-3-methyladenine glycosylase II n=1 Tax=Hymenobacter terrestris TaxID=2748310 RepID=A0ABX2Q8M7_9BACT|nr:DNA-3-methyladenine glycosylase 2 family protein [Hymenobacter terrestris]NVO86326.1 DNA-3-methyladenine glycosylase 2 family protein [Hymenobacter terrestris]
MPSPPYLDLPFTGDYSLAASVTLAASALFVDKLYPLPAGEVLDLAFALEGSWSPVGVRIDQPIPAQVRAQVLANPDGASPADIRAQLRRILFLAVDGTDFAAVAARDQVVAGLQQRQSGLRPVLLPSPYEAAARAIIGHQLPVRQAAAITVRIAEEHGVRVEVDEHVLHAFTAASRLAELPLVRGLATRKVEQLRALGTAAPGWLDSAHLRTLARPDALAHLQKLPGIGPFSAELILLRGVGDPDAFPREEKRLHRAMAAAYQLGDEPAVEKLERIAQGWRPYRSWVGLLLRNSISR